MKRTLLIILCLFSTAHVFAQKTDFSGDYAIDTNRISFEEAPHWVLPVSFKVRQQGTTVTIERNTVNAEGKPDSYTNELKPGDTVTTAMAGNRYRKTVISWNPDQSGFTLTYVTEGAGGQFAGQATEKWSLVDDGKTLYIDRYVEQADGLKYPIKAYYSKTE